MHIAMYDAVSSIDGNYTPFATRVTNVPAGASREAAAIEAAYRILASVYPTTTFPGPAMQFANFYATDLGAISPSQAKTDGMAVGLAAASGLIALRQNDGFRAIVPYTFLPLGPGVYQKTPGPDGTIGSYVGPATPWLKQFKPLCDPRAGSVPRRSASGSRQRAVGGGFQRGEGLRCRVQPAELAER